MKKLAVLLVTVLVSSVSFTQTFDNPFMEIPDYVYDNYIWFNAKSNDGSERRIMTNVKNDESMAFTQEWLRSYGIELGHTKPHSIEKSGTETTYGYYSTKGQELYILVTFNHTFITLYVYIL